MCACTACSIYALEILFVISIAKLGHSHTKNNYCLYTTNELSQLMLNLYVLSRAGSFLRHAVEMQSLCEYHDLYRTNHIYCETISRWNLTLKRNLGNFLPLSGTRTTRPASRFSAAPFGSTLRSWISANSELLYTSETSTGILIRVNS